MAFRLTKDQKVRLRDLGDLIAKEKAALEAVSADALGRSRLGDIAEEPGL